MTTTDGMMQIIEEQLHIITKGRSSTVSLDKATDLIESIKYVLRFQSVDVGQSEANRIWLPEPVELSGPVDVAVYDKALENLILITKQTIEYYGQLMQRRLPVDNLVYNETFENAIPAYLANYDPRVGAHMTDCDMDYPLARDEMREIGIVYIIGYLMAFSKENDFCLFFGREAVGNLLHRFAERMKVEASEFPINLFLLCLEQAVLINMTDEGIRLIRGRNMLLFRKDMYRELSSRLNGKPQGEVERLLRTSAQEVVGRVMASTSGFGGGICDYMHVVIEDMVPRLTGCVLNGTLEDFVYFV